MKTRSVEPRGSQRRRDMIFDSVSEGRNHDSTTRTEAGAESPTPGKALAANPGDKEGLPSRAFAPNTVCAAPGEVART